MRLFISAAAASVKVTTSRPSTPQRSLASQTRWAQRAARTAVLPDPAAAETSRLMPVVTIPARCSGVHCGVVAVPVLLIAVPLDLDDPAHDAFAAEDVEDAVALGGLEAAD